ncbi:MAG: endolytic transglycosylase MltG [Bacteroidota bacterium]
MASQSFNYKKYLIGIMVFVLFMTTLIATVGYYKFLAPSIQNVEKYDPYVYIPTGTDFNEVKSILSKKNLIDNVNDFEWLAKQMNYVNHIKPGKYKIHNGMSNKEMIDMLRAGRQEKVMLSINNIRKVEGLALLISSKLEADTSEIIKLFSDSSFLAQYGFNKYNSIGVIIPNTYEFYWNTSAKQFFLRMLKEYHQFWTVTRLQAASELGLDPKEVSVVASIVEKETRKVDEKPILAGIYLNRLEKGWKLEADPTLVYALNDFTINRVLNVHKKIISPYNTYLNFGLPPGPICTPSIESLDAVLHRQKSAYMFFCAKEDFSGYHNYAVTYNEHLRNARIFQAALNKRGIMN